MPASTPTDQTTLTPTQAIRQFSQGEVGRNRLFQALVRHDNWLLPLQKTEDGPAVRSFRGEEGRPFFVLFTGREALNKSLEAQGQQAVGEEVHELRGLELFTGPSFSDVYDWVLIDPDGPAAIKLPKAQFAELREWASMYKLDEAILALQNGHESQKAIATLMQHQPWIVVASGPEKRLALVPDGEQRKIGAVFSSFNAADRYVQALSEHLPEGVKLQPVILTADKLFAELSRLDIMGAVVNCFGPTPGRAFSKAFIDEVAVETGG